MDYSKLSKKELQDRIECSPKTIQKHLVQKGIFSENLCIDPKNDSLYIQFKGALFDLARYNGRLESNSVNGTLIGSDQSTHVDTESEKKQNQFLSYPEPKLLANYLHNLSIILTKTSEKPMSFGINSKGYADGVRYHSNDFDDAISANANNKEVDSTSRTYFINNWKNIVSDEVRASIKPEQITLDFLSNSASSENEIVRRAGSQIRNHYLAYARALNITKAFLKSAEGTNIPGITGIKTSNINIEAYNSKELDNFYKDQAGYCSPRRGALFEITGDVIKQQLKKPTVEVNESTEIAPEFTTPSTSLMYSMSNHAVVTLVKDIQDFINMDEKSEGNFQTSDENLHSRYSLFMKKFLLTFFKENKLKNLEEADSAEQIAYKNFEIVDLDNIRSMIINGQDTKEKILDKVKNVLYAKSTGEALEYIKAQKDTEFFCNAELDTNKIDFKWDKRVSSLNHIMETDLKCYISFYKRFLGHYIDKFYENANSKDFLTVDKFFIYFVKEKYKLTDESSKDFLPLVYWIKRIFLSNLNNISPQNLNVKDLTINNNKEKIISISVNKEIKARPRSKTKNEIAVDNLSDKQNRAPRFMLDQAAFTRLTQLMLNSHALNLKAMKMYGPIVNRDAFNETDSVYKNFTYARNDFLEKDNTGKIILDDDKYLWLLEEYSDAYGEELAHDYYQRISRHEKIHDDIGPNIPTELNKFLKDSPELYFTLDRAVQGRISGSPGRGTWNTINVRDEFWKEITKKVTDTKNRHQSNIHGIEFFNVTDKDENKGPFKKDINFSSPEISQLIFSIAPGYFNSSIKDSDTRKRFVLASLDPQSPEYQVGSDQHKNAIEFMNLHYHPFHGLRKALRIFWNSYMYSIIAHSYGLSFMKDYKYTIRDNSFSNDKNYDANLPVGFKYYFPYNDMRYVKRFGNDELERAGNSLPKQAPPSVPATTIMSFMDFSEAYAEGLNILAGGSKTNLDYKHRGNTLNKDESRFNENSYTNIEKSILSKMYKPVPKTAKRVFYTPDLITSTVKQNSTKYTGFFHRACKTGVLMAPKDKEFYYQSRYKEVKSNYDIRNNIKARDKIYFDTYQIPHPENKMSGHGNKFPSFNLIQLKRPTAYLINNCADCSCLKTGNLTGKSLKDLVASATRIDFSYGYTLKEDNYKEKEFTGFTQSDDLCLFSPIVPQSHDVGEGSSEELHSDEDHDHNENEYLKDVFACPMIDALYLDSADAKTIADKNLNADQIESILQSCKEVSVFPLPEKEYVPWCLSGENDVCDQYTDKELKSLSVNRNQHCRRTGELKGNNNNDTNKKFPRPKAVIKEDQKRKLNN